jgi:hypothetical protein
MLWYNVSLQQLTAIHERGRINIQGNKADFAMAIKILLVTATREDNFSRCTGTKTSVSGTILVPSQRERNENHFPRCTTPSGPCCTNPDEQWR